ncbi:response regulator [Altererythrobacter sp. BO-6]|uniref:ATP-binding response regulator n=1 Tax=Altererythrobacter sp. BO-6 TaxID=2604537 RepID=UPI0013E16F17|nr:hybrid sensor histidine kinase/response regulator [Altererythrobacter sp. BO-6]QIG54547.1 response regulator [Altererythrobacter sp. BO-6]
MMQSSARAGEADDLSLQDEIASEQNQSKQRLIITHLIVVYVLLLGSSFGQAPALAPWAMKVITYYAFYLPIVLWLFIASRLKPGRVPIRRIIGIAADIGFLGLALATDRTLMMPIYTIFIWVTLGNGMRYGRRYLVFAALFALTIVLSVGLLLDSSPIEVFITATMALAVLAIPLYASALLRRVEDARREADRANVAKSLFLARASHDLRQPIHAISLFVTGLQQSGLKPEQRGIVDRIDRSLDGLSRLFRSLLDLSTLDSGSVKPALRPVALGELLSELVQQNAQLAAWHGCELRYVPTCRTVLADESLLATMVQNLLSNAFKFAPGGKVLVGARMHGDTVSLQVLDQGKGIDPAHLPFLFDEFYQIREQGGADRQGVGLGLNIVARLSELMGLKVAVRSQPGEGTCFSIDGLRPAQPMALTSAPHTSARLPSPLAGMQVLLVEDDPDIRSATKELIEGWSCAVIALDGIPAQIAQKPDLLIADYDLGGGRTGADCIQAVRQLVGTSIPAIIITGHEGEGISQAIGDPSIAILRKPLRPAELRSAISATRFAIQPVPTG